MANIQHIFTGTAAPATAPTAVGHHYVDTVAKKVYQSVGTSSVSDWVSIDGYTDSQIDSFLALKADDSDLTSHVTNTSNPHSVTKTQVGLSNVDNTSDLNKPISTATQSALDLKYNSSNPSGYQTSAQVSTAVGTAITTHEGLSDPHPQYLTSAEGAAAYANISHTHGLSDLTQSGATTGQIPKWNGTSWAPANDDSGGGGTWGSITGTLSDQTDLQDALDAKEDDITANDNELLYQDNSGVKKGLPNYYVDTVTKSIKSNINFEPNDNNSGFQVDQIQTSFRPLQNSPNDSYNIRDTFVNIDPDSSGFNLGSNGTSIRMIMNNLNHFGTGDLGQIEFTQNNFQIGNGTDPIEVRGFSYAFGFGEINDNVTMTQSMQGYGFQPHVHSGAIMQNNLYSQAFYDGANIECASPNHTSFNASPNIAAIQNNNNYTGVNINANIGEFVGNAGYTGIGIYGNLGTFGTGSYAGLRVNPNIDSVNYAVGIEVDVSNIDVYPGVKASLIIQDLTLEFIQASSDFNAYTIEYVDDVTAGSENAVLAGQAITVHIESGVSTATQVKAAIEADFTLNSNLDIVISGTASNPQVTQAATNFTGGINSGTKRAAYFKGDVQIDGNFGFSGALSLGKLNAYASQTLVDGGGNPGTVHMLISAPTIGDNLTVANADLIGVNTASLISIGTNSVVTTSFLGIAALGLPAVVSMKTGATVDRITGALFALSLDASGTGGTVDQLALCKALAIPNGATTVNELYGYEMDLPFGDPGTQTWGLMIRPDVNNFLAGNLKLGGSQTVANANVALEIESTTKAFVLSRMDTTQRNAMTAITGMVIFNTTTNTLQYYDGTSWV